MKNLIAVLVISMLCLSLNACTADEKTQAKALAAKYGEKVADAALKAGTGAAIATIANIDAQLAATGKVNGTQVGIAAARGATGALVAQPPVVIPAP